MSSVSLAVDNETARKVKNRPRVGVKHGTSNEVAVLRLLRSTLRVARSQVMRRLEKRRPFSLRSDLQASAQNVEANRFAEMVYGCANELDEAGLLILEHALRALWVSSNPRKTSSKARQAVTTATPEPNGPSPNGPFARSVRYGNDHNGQ